MGADRTSATQGQKARTSPGLRVPAIAGSGLSLNCVVRPKPTDLRLSQAGDVITALNRYRRSYGCDR